MRVDIDGTLADRPGRGPGGRRDCSGRGSASLGSAACRATSIVERENFRLYLPITTSILVSVALSLILWLLNR